MKTTYADYVATPKHLTFEQMENIHHQMLIEIDNEPDANEIYEELVEKATKYADFRAQWFLWSREERMKRDEYRTSAHNSLIISFNMLARYLKMIGKDATWRDELGYEEDDKYNRKAIGDFACYIVFVNSINAR